MKWKKMLAALLAFTLAFGVLPTTVFATELESSTYGISDGEYEITGTYEIDTYLGVYGGSLTITGVLKFSEEDTLSISGGKVTVSKGGKVDLSNLSQVEVLEPGVLLFEEGAKSKVKFDSKKIPADCKWSASSDEEGYYTVEKDTSETVDGLYISKRNSYLRGMFADFSDALVLSTAQAAISQKIRRPISEAEVIVTQALKHLTYLNKVLNALNEAKNDVTQLAATYTARYPNYAGSGNTLLTTVAANAVSENFTTTAGGYYNDKVKSYSVQDDNTLEGYVSGDQGIITQIDAAKDTSTEAVDQALFTNAKNAIKAEINNLTSLGEDTSTYTAQLDTVKLTTGPDGVKALEAVLATATLENARKKATNELNAAYGSVESPAIQKLLQQYLDTIRTAKSVASIELAQAEAEAIIGPQVEDYTLIKESIAEAKTAANSYIDNNADKEGWTTRLQAIGKDKGDLTKDGTGVKVDTTPIENATTTSELENAKLAVENATKLAVEKLIASWELDAAAKVGDGEPGKGNTEYEQSLTDIADEYKGYINNAPTIGDVKNNLRYGQQAIEDRKVMLVRSDAIGDVKTDIQGLYKTYKHYFENVDDSDWSAEDGMTNAAKILLDRHSGYINEAPASTVAGRKADAITALEAQFISDLRTMLIKALDKEIKESGRHFYDESAQTDPGAHCVLLDEDGLNALSNRLSAAIVDTTTGSAAAKAKADALIAKLGTAKEDLKKVEAFELKIADETGAIADAETKVGFYKNGDSVLLEAPAEYNGNYFELWECTEGGFSSVKTRRMTVKMTNTCTWEPKYGGTAYQTPSGRGLTFKADQTDETYLKLIAEREIFESSVKAYGILYSTGVDSAETLTSLKYTDIQGRTSVMVGEGKNQKVSIANVSNGTGIGSYTVKILWTKLNPANDTLYAVAYYVDSSNEMHFSDPVTVTRGSSGWGSTPAAAAAAPQMQGPSIEEAPLQPSQEPVQASASVTEPAQEEGQAQTQDIPEE